MQCVNCGKSESKHLNKACPLGSGFHLTQQLNPHRQCRHWQGKVCTRPAACLTLSCRKG